MRHQYDNMTSAILKQIFALAIFTTVYTGADAMEHRDDNVFIIDGTETWQIVAPKGGKNAYVKSTIDHTYEATRYKESIKPYVFYNDRVTLDKAYGKGKPRYESATSRNVFHDDNRVCYIDIDLDGPGKKSKTHFERTLNDPAFFTRLYLADDYPIKHKTVTITIPAEYPEMSIEERNFTSADGSPISLTIENRPDGSRAYTYTLTNLDGTMRQDAEKRSPHPMRYQPVIIIKGWFGSLDSLFDWHVGMVRVDTDIPDINSFLTQNVYAGDASGLTSRQKLEKIYAWVQNNIRYVAYEEGESGHRPDRPAEVIRKRYGDCKGMALLVATLLRHEGIEAWMASVGTDNIPFNIADVPSIGTTDHSVCVAVENGDTLYLDATNEYIPADHIPGTIQGKDAILLPVNDKEKCMLHNIPTLAPAETAIDSVCYNYTLVLGHAALVGTVTRTLSGDFKEIYITRYSEKGEKHTDEEIALDLVPLRRSQISVEDLERDFSSSSRCATIKAPIINSEAITDASPAVYVELDARNGIKMGRIDNHDRRAPYWLPARGRIVRRSQLSLPEGASVTYLPEPFTATLPQATFSVTFSSPDGTTVVMHKAMEIKSQTIAIDEIEQWNRVVSDWENACKSQIEITL